MRPGLLASGASGKRVAIGWLEPRVGLAAPRRASDRTALLACLVLSKASVNGIGLATGRADAAPK